MMTSLCVIYAFFVVTTNLLRVNPLRTRITQDGKSLIFNSKVSDPSTRSFDGLSATLFNSKTFLTTVDKFILPFNKNCVFLQFQNDVKGKSIIWNRIALSQIRTNYCLK